MSALEQLSDVKITRTQAITRNNQIEIGRGGETNLCVGTVARYGGKVELGNPVLSGRGGDESRL